MKKKILLILGLAFLLLSFSGMAAAALIPGDTAIASLCANRGDGLNGYFYDTGSRMMSLADADAFIASNSPTATFSSSLVDYPNGATDYVGDTTSLESYLGVDAASLSGSGDITLDGSIFVYSGFIAISRDFDIDTSDSDIDVNFAVASDDGFRLNISGITVTSHPDERNYGYSTGTASFTSEGLYAIELLYYEDLWGTGIEFFSTILGGPNSGAPSGFAGIVPTSVLSTSPYQGHHNAPVPEPATIWLLGLALAGLAGTGIRKKKDR